MKKLEKINDFIAQKNLAVVGVSRNPKKFGSAVYKELKKKGYNVFAVNPQMEEFEGDKVYQSLDNLPEGIDGAVFSLPPSKTYDMIDSVVAKGINRVWLLNGSSDQTVIDKCENLQLSYVHGECILMYANPVESFHKFHRFIWKLLGKYAKN